MELCSSVYALRCQKLKFRILKVQLAMTFLIVIHQYRILEIIPILLYISLRVCTLQLELLLCLPIKQATLTLLSEWDLWYAIMLIIGYMMSSSICKAKLLYCTNTPILTDTVEFKAESDTGFGLCEVWPCPMWQEIRPDTLWEGLG